MFITIGDKIGDSLLWLVTIKQENKKRSPREAAAACCSMLGNILLKIKGVLVGWPLVFSLPKEKQVCWSFIHQEFRSFRDLTPREASATGFVSILCGFRNTPLKGCCALVVVIFYDGVVAKVQSCEGRGITPRSPFKY